MLRSLGRHTHLLGIVNSRLVWVSEQAVVLQFSEPKEGKTERLEPVEFLRRFVQYVLPPGFMKNRHYG